MSKCLACGCINKHVRGDGVCIQCGCEKEVLTWDQGPPPEPPAKKAAVKGKE